MKNNHPIGAIILAAGKGTRMQSKSTNKVVFKLGGKPMILHTVNLLQKLYVDPIVVIVGFARDSVIHVLKNKKVLFAEQEKQLGVAHAVMCGIKKLPSSVSHVIVMNGDDSAFYDKAAIKKLINQHITNRDAIAFITTRPKNPSGLGRIKRDEKGNVIAIIEEKDATDEEKKIQETNVGCYVFQVEFLKEYLPKIKRSPATGEYYITDTISLAANNKLKIIALQNDTMVWRGVNTKEELDEARQLFTNQK